MAIAIYFFVIFLNLIFAFRNKQSKIVVILSLLAIIMFIGGAGPEYSYFNHSRDYLNYQFNYERVESIGITDNPQMGFTLLMKLGNLLNLDFFKFRLIVITVCLILLYKLVIKRYSYNSNFIILMYMLYPMIIDSEHLRNFIAMTIFLISIRFLEKKSFVNNVKFLIMILLATSFHIAFFLYVFLVFAHTKDRNRLAKVIAILTVVLTTITILNNNQMLFVGLLLNIVEDDKVIGYLTSRTNLGFLIPIVLHCSSIILVYWAKKILDRKNLTNQDNSKKNLELLDCSLSKKVKLANLVFWLNILGITYFPLFIMNIQFYRLVRNFLILNFIIYSFASQSLRKGTLYRFIFNLSIVGILMLWLVMDLVITTSAERVLIPFFTENYFFN